MGNTDAKTVADGPKKAAIYIRVSTSYQVDKDSLPMQRKDLIAYAELILGISEYEIFEDAGYSGKNTDRPAYQRMMERIKTREFSHILVWKIDRISRNLIDFSEMYAELKKLRIVFVSKNEQFDTSTAMGEAMLKIILVFAELERAMTAERVTATMISRASQGLWNGGRVPFGYKYNAESGQFSIREDEAAICRLIADDYIKHKSLLHTARLINGKGFRTRAGGEWSTTTVWIIVQSPFYAGIYRYNKHKGTEHRTLNDEDEWVIVEDHHPAIFSLEQHLKMKDILKENKRVQNTSEQHNKRKNTYVFGQICYCGKCGSRMNCTTGRLQVDGYRTSIYTCQKRRVTKECDNPAINDLIIGEFVVNYISNIINAKKTFSQIDSPQGLQDRLLHGQVFKGITSVDPEGLNELYTLLSRFKSDKAFTLMGSSHRISTQIDAEVSLLRKDKAKYERALKRLQDLFLYDDTAMTEKDFIIKRSELLQKIEEVNKKLGLKQSAHDVSLSDEDFIKKASHILINSRLQDREYIYYKNLAVNTSPDILRSYIHSIVDSIYVTDGLISSITFKNGITHRFTYKKG